MTRWDDVGDLRQLLDPAALTALLREGGVPETSATADHLRLKVGVNALVGVAIDATSGRLPGYVRTYASADQAARIADKWNRKRVEATELGAGVRLLPGGASVLFLFPNDAEVRRLRLLLGRPRRLACLLGDLDGFRHSHIEVGETRVETLRYKPERRVVAAAHLLVDDGPRTTVFRLRADGAGSDLAVATGRLRAALGACVPQPLGALYGGALVAEGHVPGTGLAAAVAAGDADPEALAEVIASLHSSEITLPSAVQTSDVLGRALSALELLAAVEPTIVPAADRVRSGLVAAEPPPRSATPLHGDLHLDQVILAAAGPVVLDFERAGMGPAGHDLGTLVAHLRADGHDAFAASFLDAYARTREVDSADLAFFVGCGLVQRALLAFRSLRPGWWATVPHLLELARQELAGRPRWDVTFPRRDEAWPAWTERSGVRRYGRWHPALRSLVEAEPHDDDALPALGPLLDRGGVLAAYRPGQRAVVRVEREEGVQFVKVVSPRRARRLVTRTCALRDAAATAGFPVLAPIVESCVEEGTVSFGELPGPTLRDLLLVGEGDDALPALAAAVAALQAAAVPEGIEVGSGSSLDDWLGFVSDHAATLNPSYQRVLQGLPRPPLVERLALSHGDLHDGNVVVTDAGIGLLDLDGISATDPVSDIGNLLAHLVLRSLQRSDEATRGYSQGELLLAAYRAAGGEADDGAVLAETARTLFRLACVYRFRGRWQALAPYLLHESQRVAARS